MIEEEKELDQIIEDWKKSKEDTPLIIEFDEGEKFIFIKVA